MIARTPEDAADLHSILEEVEECCDSQLADGCSVPTVKTLYTQVEEVEDADGVDMRRSYLVDLAASCVLAIRAIDEEEG